MATGGAVAAGLWPRPHKTDTSCVLDEASSLQPSASAIVASVECNHEPSRFFPLTKAGANNETETEMIQMQNEMNKDNLKGI